MYTTSNMCMSKTIIPPYHHTWLLVSSEEIHDRILLLVGEKQAALVPQESRHLVKVLVVLAGLVAPEGQRHDTVLAHEELGVRPRVLAQLLR